MQSKGPHQAAKLSEEDASKKTKTKIKNLAVWPLHETGNDMIFCKLMQAQSKGMKSTWLTVCGCGAGRVRFQGAKKRPHKGQEPNTLVVNAVKEVLNDSWSEVDPDNLNLENLGIRKEWDNASRKRQNEAEVQGKSTDARQGLSKISHLVNPTKKGGVGTYTPVLLGNINGRLGKAKFHSLRILLDSVAISSMVLEKHAQNNYVTKRPILSNRSPKVVTFWQHIPPM